MKSSTGTASDVEAAEKEEFDAAAELLHKEEKKRVAELAHKEALKKARRAVNPELADAESIILMSASAAAGAGLLPFPGIDLMGIGGIQFNMLRLLAKKFEVALGENWGKATFGSLVASIGAGTIATPVIASVIKIIPFVGSVAGTVALPTVAFSSTYALGKVFAAHFASGGNMLNFDLNKARKAYKEYYKNAPTTKAAA